MDNQFIEQIKQSALRGYAQSIEGAISFLQQAETYKKVLEDVGGNIDNEYDLSKYIYNATIPAAPEGERKKITQFESVVLNILEVQGMQMLTIDIKDEFNRITQKNYTRRNMASALAKMEDKRLIKYERIMDGKIAKFLWYLPKWENEEGAIKKEYLKNNLFLNANKDIK